jgi:hypothetical protein
MRRQVPQRKRRVRSAEMLALLDAINRCEIRDAPGRKWFARERWPEVQTQSSLCAEAAFPSRTRWALGGGGFRVAMQSAAE